MKRLIAYIKSLFEIPDELKDALQNLQVKEEGYLYLGTE